MPPRVSARRLVLDGWPLVLALVLVLPLVTRSGHPLARDLVFVPHQPWTDASLGLGNSAPRAVPLDALVSLLTAHLLDGGVLARVAIPLILATAGWGAHRLVGDLGLVARLAAGGLAVWNPYVVERLALGQWALLTAYAALPWLIMAARRFRAQPGWATAGAVVAWLGLASLTPTGGVIGSLTVLVAGLGRRRRPALVLGGLCLLLQLTWLLPSALTTSALTSDPAAVAAFAADGEGPGGVWVAVLGLGGIWDSGSIPDTRASGWGIATAVVAVAALVVGGKMLAERCPRGDVARLAALSGIGLILAVLPTVPAGAALLRWAVSEVPGAGLLRDSQKFLAPYVLMVVCAFGACVHRLVRAVIPAGVEIVITAAIAAVGLPFLLLPDGPWTVWPTVDPVHYPAGWSTVAEHVDGEDGTLAVLPWRSYRRFAWGHGLTSSDPAARWFDVDVLTSDELQVGRTLLGGESSRAAALGRALAMEQAAEALRDSGVRWALVYLDDPATPDLDLAGLDLVHADDDLALYAVPGAPQTVAAPGVAARSAVLASMLAALVAVLVGLALSASARFTRSARPTATLVPEKREKT